MPSQPGIIVSAFKQLQKVIPVGMNELFLPQ